MRIALLLFCIISFTSLTAQINFEEQSQQLNLILSYYGNLSGGVSFVDFNNDGLDDLSFATGNDSTMVFYQNTGSGFIQTDFEIHNTEEIKQLLWVDFDNDGDKDLFVAGYESSNRLYRNDQFEFEDITMVSGLDTIAYRSYGANWADVNRDGWLDLYYTERAIPLAIDKNRNRLFLSDRKSSFIESGMSLGAEDKGKLPFCAGIFDYNNDNWPDIYTAQDRMFSNALFRNEGDGIFTDVSESSCAGITVSAMSVTMGDINNDQLTDLYITNIAEGNKLLIQDSSGSCQFVEQADEAGVAQFNVSWGANFLDADNDGLLDLYVSGVTPFFEEYSSALYQNVDGTSFEQILLEGDTTKSHANAYGDFDNNGLLDIAVSNKESNVHLWTNKSVTDNNWVSFRLEGLKSNSDAIGSKITIHCGTEVQNRELRCGEGFLGQNSNTLHFGIGANTEIDSAIIKWPTGHEDILRILEVNKNYSVIEGETTDTIYIDSSLHKYYYPALPEPLFTEVSKSKNIEHIFAQVNFMGGGVCFFDFDNDNDDDIYLTSGTRMDQVYLNDGAGNFTNISDQCNIDVTADYYTTGVCSGDFDNDGLTDLFITTFGNDFQAFGKNLLLINQGDLTFEEYWFYFQEEHRAASIGAISLDYDLDGNLDLYVINYVEEAGFDYDMDGNIIGYAPKCFSNKFYRNTGNLLQFEDLTEELGLEEIGCGLAAMATDFDMDGDPDILLANDFGEWLTPNKLYRNDLEEDVFTEVGELYNANDAIYGMGITSADYDRDQDLDYYITNFGANVFLQNEGSIFVDQAAQIGIADEWEILDSVQSVSWGANFLDYDNDGFEDLFVANGFIPSPDFLSSRLKNQDRFFINKEGQFFEEINPEESGIDNTFVSRGSAIADTDMDGDLDILSVVQKVPVSLSSLETRFLQNNLENDNHFVKLKLEGTLANKTAIGAFVEVHSQGERYIYEHHGGSSHCSKNTDFIHIGLGDNVVIDSVKVRWPSETGWQSFDSIMLDKLNFIVEDTSSLEQDTMIISSVLEKETKLQFYPNPSSGKLVINTTDRKIESLKLFNTNGSLVKQISLNSKSYKHTVMLDGLESGVYFIKWNEEGKAHLEKLILINSE